ncbi:ABC transporter substrate-binding protein [Candidatus Odyssella thessalonicensis]|uniref:ABC transporter substrate-binding protein n=1 Tax=Candidatus Odyssella thessalonicensis TaxID=84647 RepID=UPI000225C13F|nr:ABC transporter substrate binding protein [Candidatus Odyssella thessalonicensis]
MKRRLKNILLYIFILGFISTAVIYNVHKPIVLVLHSYNADYSWTRDVNEGIKKVLVSTGYYNVRWHYMDTKNNPSDAHKSRAGLIARRVIDEIKPNIILAVDDDAQEYISKYYVDNPQIKIIFSGVNATPEAYGFESAQNVTGILERIPLKGLKDTLEQIRNINPQIKDIRILHLSDDSNTVQADDEFIHTFGSEWGEVKVLPSILVHTFRDWKKAVMLAPTEVNFLIVSNYRKVYDDDGRMVPPAEIVKWTVENSKIPVIGLNGFTVEDGAKFAVATSPFEQGEVAAKMVLDILQNDKNPKEIPITQTKQFIIYMRGKFDLHVPAIYEAFARAANKYWEK